jgi:serine/threonine protein kinase
LSQLSVLHLLVFLVCAEKKMANQKHGSGAGTVDTSVGRLGSLLFQPHELSEWMDDCTSIETRICRATFGKHSVVVRRTVTESLYDLGRFLCDAAALSNALQSHVAPLVGIYYERAKIPIVDAAGSASKNDQTPQHASHLMTLHEESFGPLLSDLIGQSVYTLAQRMEWCQHLAAAMAHYHSLQIVHGALSPRCFRMQRISIPSRADNDKEMKFIDSLQLVGMDLVRYCLHDSKEQQDLVTLRYMHGTRTATLPNDIFTLGYLIAASLTGVEPWPDQSILTLAQKILTLAQKMKEQPCDLRVLDAVRQLNTQHKLSMDWLLLIEQCTSIAPLDRPTIDEVQDRIRLATASTRRLIASFSKQVDGLNGLKAPHVDPRNDCDIEREKQYELLGTMDRKMLIAEQTNATAFYIIHRSNGHIALASRGLADPDRQDPSHTTGFGLELWAEADEKEVGTGQMLGTSFLFQMIHEVAGNVLQIGIRLRQLLDLHKLVSMELNNVDAPPVYKDPNSGRVCILLGVPSPDLPEFLEMSGHKIRLVTLRLLTHAECLVIRRFAAAGRSALCELFVASGSRHISTSRHASAAAVAGPSTGLGGAQHNAVSPINTIPLPAPIAPVAPAASITPVAPVAPFVPIPCGPSRVVKALSPGLLTRLPLPHAASWDANRLRDKLVELKVPIPIAVRQAVVEKADAQQNQPNQSPTTIPIPVLQLLPPYDARDYEPTVTPAILFQGFARHGLLSSAMCMLHMRLLMLYHFPTPTDGTPVPLSIGLARHVNNTLSTQTQLGGWVHTEEYIISAQGYLNRISCAVKAAARAKLHEQAGGQPAIPISIALSPDDSKLRPIGSLQVTGEALVKRLLARVQWVAELFARANQDFDPDFCLHVVGSDGAWMDEAGNFMKEAESKVTTMLTNNRQKFAGFRDLQKRGVAWPHNSKLRREIEAAGFVFRPMMVKRDRCVCDQCGVEISGWRYTFHTRVPRLLLTNCVCVCVCVDTDPG